MAQSFWYLWWGVRLQWFLNLERRPISQIPQYTCPIFHNAPFRTEMCTFLFWMVYCGIWDDYIVGFIRLFYSTLAITVANSPGCLNLLWHRVGSRYATGEYSRCGYITISWLDSYSIYPFSLGCLMTRSKQSCVKCSWRKIYQITTKYNKAHTTYTFGCVYVKKETVVYRLQMAQSIQYSWRCVCLSDLCN